MILYTIIEHTAPLPVINNRKSKEFIGNNITIDKQIHILIGDFLEDLKKNESSFDDVLSKCNEQIQAVIRNELVFIHNKNIIVENYQNSIQRRNTKLNFKLKI